MNMNFYDIESLENVFTLANFDEKRNHIDIYYLIDDDTLRDQFRQNFHEAKDRIYRHNLNFTGTIDFIPLNKDFDVHRGMTEQQYMRLNEKQKHDIGPFMCGQEGVAKLSRTFGCWDSPKINDNTLDSIYPDEFRLVCDTDANYNNDEHPYLAGYNSFNYDTTMLAEFFERAWICYKDDVNTNNPSQLGLAGNDNCIFKGVTAKEMREFNDRLFTPQFKNAMPSALYTGLDNTRDFDGAGFKIRRNMMLSGRHLDIARLNEKQSKVALKRLLGMLGYQILESDKLKPTVSKLTTLDEILDLIAYNVSDIVNLRMLFYHKSYQAQFELKLGLLHTYPELIYERMKASKPGEEAPYKPDIRPCKVRKDRLNIDASSAQFATKSLCPYGHITDIPVVSFLYPAKEKADELGIKQVNILEETKKFFYGLYPDAKHKPLRDKFDMIYNYYKSIEGKNFNNSKSYNEDYCGDPNFKQAESLTNIPKPTDGDGTFMPYYDADGNPTSCYVIFSTGGVHGAEYNKTAYDFDCALYEQSILDLDEVKSIYPNPVDLRKAKTVTLSDGRTFKYSVFLVSGKKVAESEYKKEIMPKPILAGINKKGMTELTKKYNFTSADEANHEDFTSYYPNLLRMMMAFFNKGLGYDRYAEIFDQKQEYGKKMKDKSYSEKERDSFRIRREGVKLILNSASGAADAAFENNIRANNQIISMRIIGQLFSWRIGQAQAYRGSKVISTNTDGLYSVMEATLNNKILEEESKNIGVEIEPEPMFLISKDTNNRIELTKANGEILGASGGTLGCRKGPNPNKALAHPAILDWALTEYLTVAATGYKGLGLDKDFDREIGRNILERSKTAFEPLQFLLMYQNIVASSPSSITYIYGLTDEDPDNPIILQHYNRMFIMKDGTADTLHLWASAAAKVKPAQKKKREKDGDKPAMFEPRATFVLKENGIDIDSIKHNNDDVRDIISKKVTNIEPDWYIKIINNDLHYLTQTDFDFIKNNLDYEKYLDKLATTYENSWRNHVPDIAETTATK